MTTNLRKEVENKIQNAIRWSIVQSKNDIKYYAYCNENIYAEAQVKTVNNDLYASIKVYGTNITFCCFVNNNTLHLLDETIQRLSECIC